MVSVDSFEEELGAVAGRYVIEEVLGRGGMGAVYRVRDSRSGQTLALKRGLSTNPSKAHRREALLQHEYHTLAQLAHPRIIEVYDYGVDERGPYYTMELLDGTDLDASKHIAWREACGLLCDLASSLAILHSRGLLHRDVSARNVRRTADGRAKLLDFGAMTSMGVVKEVVGTPPFVPPEALQLQPLDGRADLFSLGALAYYMLTGRHAYPARRLNELRDVWRSRPTPPARLVADLPPALNALVLQLLSLDRSARPANAAEVMGHLSAIAGLPVDEHDAVSHAYLTTPNLIGREPAVLALRRRLLSLSRSDGGTLLVEGVAGSGRSRLLDACAIEGKLVGATVLRADASDAASGAWGVTRALGSQLRTAMPEQFEQAAERSRRVLMHVLEDLHPRHTEATVDPLPDPSLLLRELRDFILALSRVQRLVVVVDDVDRIDERSAALLAALSHKTARYPLVLAMSIDSGDDTSLSASLRLLRSLADRVVLEQLSAEQTESLMRSVFGDVPNLSLTAASIYALSHGNPRTAMLLAQHLVDRGRARYQGGSWSLPAQLDDSDLPQDLSASLRLRLDEVSPEARALCEILALAGTDGLGLVDYPKLTEDRDPGRVSAALDELVAARILVAAGEHYQFSQRGFARLLCDAMSHDRARTIHARIAQLLTEQDGDVLSRAHHLLEGGREREAIELLCTLDLRSTLPAVSLLEASLVQAERLGLAARIKQLLRMALLAKAASVLAVDSFSRHAPRVLAQMEHDSGLLHYSRLSNLPDHERLGAALTQAQSEYDQTPADQRVHSVIEAIRELGSLAQAFCITAMTVHDLDLMRSFPSIDPLVPLSPALEIVRLGNHAAEAWMCGRVEQAKQMYETILAQLESSRQLGLDDATQRRGRMSTIYALAIFEATMAIPRAEERATLLEEERELRVNAWRVRYVFHLNRGDVEQARKCLRRAELFQLQDGIRGSYLGTTAGIELLAQSRIGDLAGVRTAVAALHVLAAQHPGWRPVYLLGQAEQRRLEGDPERALEHVRAALVLAEPGRHVFFACIAAAHIVILCQLSRRDEACTQARAYLASCEREGLGATDPELYAAATEALAAAGQHPDALQLVEHSIATSEALGRSGTALALLYQARARLAIWMQDRPAFERFAELTAREYRRANNPTLSTRIESLLDEAQQTQIGPLSPLPEVSQLIAYSQTQSEYDTMYSRMGECLDANDRARCALTLLLEHLESFAGYLFGIEQGKVELLAAVPDLAHEPTLDAWVAEEVTAELTASEADASHSARYLDPEGRPFECIVLCTTRDDEQMAAAALVVQVARERTRRPDRALLSRMAAELLDHGDVRGAALPSVKTA